jgi:hypothetical protein
MRIIEPEHLPFAPVQTIVVRLSPEGSTGSADVRVKKLSGGRNPLSCKAEYDDLYQALSLFGDSFPLSFKTIKSAVELTAMTGEEIHVGGLVFSPLEER